MLSGTVLGGATGLGFGKIEKQFAKKGLQNADSLTRQNYFDDYIDGLNNQTQAFKGLNYRDEWIKIDGKDYHILNLPKKNYGKIMHIIDTNIKQDQYIGEVISKPDDMYSYTFQKVSPTEYKFIGRKKLK